MSESISLSFTTTARLIREAMTAQRPPGKPRNLAIRIALWTVFFLVLLYFVKLVDAVGVSLNQTLFFLAGVVLSVGILALVIYLKIRNDTNREASRQLKNGSTHVEFSDGGVEIQAYSGKVWMKWQGIDEIVGTKKGTVLICGLGRYIIPDDALPQGLEPEDFKSRLNKWKSLS